MDYTFDQIFAADPGTPGNVAGNSLVTIFAPGDVAMVPIALRKVDGTPMPNPVQTNANGFGGVFIADIERVAWSGGEYSGFFTSYDGMAAEAQQNRVASEESAVDSAASKDAAVAAQTAAEGAADSAAALLSRALPPAGAVGQVLTKKSATNYDADWVTPPDIPAAPGVPTGGSAGQVLTKNTGTSFDTKWSNPPVPAGGSAGQVLTKNSATSGDVGWMTPDAGGGVLNFADLTGVQRADQLPAGGTLLVKKSGSTWPARPTARADITVTWLGADPSPAIVDSGTGGMLRNVDLRSIPQ